MLLVLILRLAYGSGRKDSNLGSPSAHPAGLTASHLRLRRTGWKAPLEPPNLVLPGRPPRSKVRILRSIRPNGQQGSCRSPPIRRRTAAPSCSPTARSDGGPLSSVGRGERIRTLVRCAHPAAPLRTGIPFGERSGRMRPALALPARWADRRFESSDQSAQMANRGAVAPLPSIWSGRKDSNLRPSAPKADALPGCATPRMGSSIARGGWVGPSAAIWGYRWGQGGLKMVPCVESPMCCSC